MVCNDTTHQIDEEVEAETIAVAFDLAKVFNSSKRHVNISLTMTSPGNSAPDCGDVMLHHGDIGRGGSALIG
jgi:hypothetical protein